MIPQDRGGSELCSACGLCCNGALHTTVAVRPEDLGHVRSLGLTVEKTGDEFWFRQPCPLYRNDRCGVYQQRPPSCREYRCALLRKYEDGDVTLEDGLTIARTARQLQFEGLRFKLADSWDSEDGLRGDGSARQVNAGLALQAAALAVYLEKHFRLSGKARDADG